jgi:hypothetical protein
MQRTSLGNIELLIVYKILSHSTISTPTPLDDLKKCIEICWVI